MDSSPVATFKIHDHLHPKVSKPIQLTMISIRKDGSNFHMDVRMSMFVEKECCVLKLSLSFSVGLCTFNHSCINELIFHNSTSHAISKSKGNKCYLF